MLDVGSGWNLVGLGLSPDEMSPVQMALRAGLIYFSGLVILRVGKRRFLAGATSFDVVLGFILGSTLSRAINGDAPLGPTLAACLVLVGLHWVIGLLTVRSRTLEKWVKGRTILLLRDGDVDERRLRQALISRADFDEAIRLEGQDDPRRLRQVCMERNGEVSVLAREAG